MQTPKLLQHLATGVVCCGWALTMGERKICPSLSPLIVSLFPRWRFFCSPARIRLTEDTKRGHIFNDRCSYRLMLPVAYAGQWTLSRVLPSYHDQGWELSLRWLYSFYSCFSSNSLSPSLFHRHFLATFLAKKLKMAPF